ncbi:DUF1840 domain-containing protein [Photobacterium japonica]|uniref:DUF1840 domain-containing protein n=1 Tax=Photobacterium japonica TaxID=2910235 RepID=UPI003D14D811
MLVTFKCKTCADIVMFGDVAQQMLRMMGHSDHVPGAMEPEDIPMALAKLALATEKLHYDEQHAELAQQGLDGNVLDDEQVNAMDVEPVVSLHTRAIPLIAMLKSAQEAECFILWE